MKRPAIVRNLRPTALGTGLIALDVVCKVGSDESPRCFAGGTCGNVLTILSYFGWHAMPIGRLAPGGPAEHVEADLHRWNVATTYITQTEDGSTPIIFHRIGKRASGEPFHSFSWRCPDCGAYMPGYKPVLASRTQELITDLPACQLFFFDRISRGALDLAREVSRRGGVVVFEPSGIGEPALFRQAWALSHVVKYSHERLREIADIDLHASERESILLEIETLGADGLRYRSRLPHARTRGWETHAAFKVDMVKDAAGSGDWCTAAVLSFIARGGAKGLRKITGETLRAAIRTGQAWASWNCGFEGARGGMYEVAFAVAQDQIKHIIERGEVLEYLNHRSHANDYSKLGNFRPACHRPETTTVAPRTKRSVG